MTTSSAESSLFQTNFPAEEFVERRARILDAIGPDAHALIQGAVPVRGFELFRQTNEFFYCCGIEVSRAYLLFSGSSRRCTLYLPHRPAGHSNEGATLAAEDDMLIRRLSGVDAVFGLESLAEHLVAASLVYTPHAPAEGAKGSRDELTRADKAVAEDPWDARVSREQHLLNLLKARVPSAELRDLCPILDSLRIIKSPREIALLRKAGRLSALALIEAMRATRPGVIEYQLGAIAEHIFLTHGAGGDGYRPIIAGGANIWYSHYFRNNCALQNGDLVLMDVAPDIGNYTSDIGRLFPVNGTYAPWQRELYGFMAEYHKAVLAHIRPGVSADQVLAEAAAVMKAFIERTPFSKPIYRAAAERALLFKGHLSHGVGMSVHEPAGYESSPFRPGMVFAVDPQLWVPEEKLYIRVEDTVAVTDTGIENLTAAAPIEMDHIEALMREQCRYPDINL